MQNAAKRTPHRCRTQQERPQSNAKRDQDPPTNIARESIGAEASYEEAARGGSPAARGSSTTRGWCASGGGGSLRRGGERTSDAHFARDVLRDGPSEELGPDEGILPSVRKKYKEN